MRKYSTPDHHFLEPKVSFLYSFLFFQFFFTLEFRNGYSHLLASEAALANFRAAYSVLGDVDISYCHKGDIALQRRSNPNVVFFSFDGHFRGCG